MSIVTSIILTLILIFLLCLLFDSAKDKPKNFPPGPLKWPIFGGYLYLKYLCSKNIYNSVNKMMDVYKSDVVGLYLGSLPSVFINNIKLIREFYYNTDFDGRVDSHLARIRAFNQLLGIFFTDGIYWHIQRRFSLRYMREFGFGRRCNTLESVINNEIKEMIDLRIHGPKYNIEKEIVRGDLIHLPDYFNPPFINGVLSVVSTRTLDREDYDQLYRLGRAAVVFQRSSDDVGGLMSVIPFVTKIFPQWTGHNDAINSTHVFQQFFKKLIADVRSKYDPNEDKCFIDMYLSRMRKEMEIYGRSTFTDEQLIMTLVDYTFPAASANTQALMMAIDHILVNPTIQNKIHDEIDRVVGRDRTITLDDRKDLPYTESVIREVLRYETIVPLSLPHRAVVDTNIGGYNIPEGCLVAPNMKSMHEDKEVWGDPENFRPGRYIVDGKLCLHKDKSLPFGAGKRLCAGETYARQTMFQIFAAFMQKFHISTADGKPHTKLMPRIPGIITTVPEFWLKVTPRK